MNNISIWMLLLSVFIISGCKQELKTTLYVGDVVNVVSTKKPAVTPGQLKIEMTSIKQCNDKKEKLTAILSSFFQNLNKIQCEQNGRDDFYLASYDIPLLFIDGNISSNFKGGISVQLTNNGPEQVGLHLHANNEMVKKLDKKLSREFMGSGGIKSDDLMVTIVINNDMREKYIVGTQGMFLNGVAVQAMYPKTIPLDRRAESTIKLSDIAKEGMLGNGNMNSFATIGYVKKFIEPKT